MLNEYMLCEYIHKYTCIKSGKVHKPTSFYLWWTVEEKIGRIKMNTFFTFILVGVLNKASITFKIKSNKKISFKKNLKLKNLRKNRKYKTAL